MNKSYRLLEVCEYTGCLPSETDLMSESDKKKVEELEIQCLTARTKQVQILDQFEFSGDSPNSDNMSHQTKALEEQIRISWDSRNQINHIKAKYKKK